MRFNLIQIFVILSFSLLTQSCSPIKKFHPKAEKGVLDLREWDFEKDGNVSLDGEWEFYWKEVPKEDNFSLPEDKKSFIYVPRSWNGFSVKNNNSNSTSDTNKIDGIGYATYRLKVLLNKKVKLGIKLTNQSTSYNIYINKIKVYNNGIFGKDLEESQPSRITKYVYYDVL